MKKGEVGVIISAEVDLGSNMEIRAELENVCTHEIEKIYTNIIEITDTEMNKVCIQIDDKTEIVFTYRGSIAGKLKNRSVSIDKKYIKQAINTISYLKTVLKTLQVKRNTVINVTGCSKEDKLDIDESDKSTKTDSIELKFDSEIKELNVGTNRIVIKSLRAERVIVVGGKHILIKDSDIKELNYTRKVGDYEHVILAKSKVNVMTMNMDNIEIIRLASALESVGKQLTEYNSIIGELRILGNLDEKVQEVVKVNWLGQVSELKYWINQTFRNIESTGTVISINEDCINYVKGELDKSDVHSIVSESIEECRKVIGRTNKLGIDTVVLKRI